MKVMLFGAVVDGHLTAFGRFVVDRGEDLRHQTREAVQRDRSEFVSTQTSRDSLLTGSLATSKRRPLQKLPSAPPSSLAERAELTSILSENLIVERPSSSRSDDG